MKPARSSFSRPSRILHWLMAPLLLAMLLIGVAMISTVSAWRPRLIDLHEPLGIALLLLAILRLSLRLKGGTPHEAAALPKWQAHIAALSHYLLYGAMLAMPLLGWGMLSAAGYPLPAIAGIHLPAILPHDPSLYAWLRSAHGICGTVFFAAIVLHISAGLLHALILKDGVFSSISLHIKKQPSSKLQQ